MEEEILKLCVPSEAVRESIRGKISDVKLAEVVCGAAISLRKKIELLRDLCETCADEQDQKFLQGILGDVCSASKLVDETQKCENYVYTLEDCWYDCDIRRHKEELVGVFENIASAKAYIRKEDRESETEEDDLTWWELRVWEKTDRTEKKGLKEIVTFYLLHDEPMWFDRSLALLSPDRKNEYRAYYNMTRYRGHGPLQFGTSYCHSSASLKLPVSFQPGTVVEINTFPFGPKTVGILLAYEDFFGEDLMTLVRNEEGLWEVINLTDAFYLGRFKEQEDWISPLYRLQETEGENTEDREIFKNISIFLKGRQEWGERLLHELGTGQYTDREVQKIVHGLWLLDE